MRHFLARVPVPIFYLLGLLAAFSPVLGGQRFLFGTDTVTHDYILHWWGWQQILVRQGEWPLWCPHLFSGLPLLGAYGLCPFYPTGWLQFILPMPVAFNLQYVLGLWTGMVGMLLLARKLRVPEAVAIGIGIAFALSGHVLTLIHAGHLQKLLAVAWVPWVLLACLDLGRIIGRPSLRSWALLTIALAAQLLAAHPQIFYGSVIFAAILILPWGLVHPTRLSVRPWICALGLVRQMALIGSAALTSILLSGPQTLTAFEISSVSNRMNGVSFEEATATSYPPLELLEYLIPSVFGDSVRGSAIPYFGAWGERIVSDFLGFGLLVLATVGFLALWNNRLLGLKHNRRLGWIFGSVIVLSLLVALGRFTPLYWILWAVVPGFSSFRSPGTFMFLTNQVFLVLAALGLRSLWTPPQGPLGIRSLGIERILWSLACLGALSALYALYQNLGFQLQLATPSEALRWHIHRNLLHGGFQAIVVFGLLAVILRPQSITPALRLGALATLSLFSLITMGWANARYIRFEPLQPYIAYLTQETWRAPTNPNNPIRPLPGEWPRILDENQLLLGPIANDAGTPTGYHPIALARYEILQRLVPPTTEAFGAVMAVNYARTRNDNPPPETVGQFQQMVRQTQPSPASLWRRTQPFPPITAAAQVTVVADLEEAAALIAAAGQQGLLQTGKTILVDDDLVSVPSLQEGVQLNPQPVLQFSSPHRGRIVLGARPTAPVVLPLAVPFAPGWKAQDLAGRPLPLIPANIAATAVIIPPATTGITLKYAPYGFRLGQFLGLMVLSIMAFLALRRLGQTIDQPPA